MFMMLKKFNSVTKPLQKIERNRLTSHRTLHIPPQSLSTDRLQIKQKYRHPMKNLNQFYKPKPSKINTPLIKTVKDYDGGVNIILNK